MRNVRELLYPSLRRELHTKLSASEAEHVLACEVEDPRWLELGYNRKTFEGTVDGSSFDIQRSTAYRNTVLPRIRGRIRAKPFGSSILIHVSLAPNLLFLLAILILGFALPLFAGSHSSSGRFNSILGIGFVWAMTIVGFRSEAAKAQRSLTEILKATVAQPEAPSRE